MTLLYKPSIGDILYRMFRIYIYNTNMGKEGKRMQKQYSSKNYLLCSDEKNSHDNFGMDLYGASELKLSKRLDCILGAWFFVHKI